MGEVAGMDPRFRDAIAATGRAWTMGREDLARRRSGPPATPEAVHAVADVRRTETEFGDVPVVLFEPRMAPGRPRPLLFFLHGGGMIGGNRYGGVDRLLTWLPLEDYLVASPEYRLAPEHPHPAPADDCWAAFAGLLSDAPRRGIDASRVVVVGSSAGGGLGAGLVLRARDQGGPAVLGQMLFAPMLDDRDDTVSKDQYRAGVPWDRDTNRTAWDFLLGTPRPTDVSPYAAAARASSLEGIPSTYLDAGAVDLFRDEGVSYASRLWAAGIPTELHVWAGAVHGFDAILPDHPVTTAAYAARASWLSRLIGEGT